MFLCNVLLKCIYDKFRVLITKNVINIHILLIVRGVELDFCSKAEIWTIYMYKH